MAERLYGIWANMKQRCENPKRNDYKYYGGKGIRLCTEWEHNFENFKSWALENGYSDTLTIERNDTGKNYGPENCTWIPFAQQRQNTTQSRLLTIGGRTQNLKAWCEELGLNYNAIFQRIHRGMDEKDALILPIGGGHLKCKD